MNKTIKGIHRPLFLVISLFGSKIPFSFLFSSSDGKRYSPNYAHDKEMAVPPIKPTRCKFFSKEMIKYINLQITLCPNPKGSNNFSLWDVIKKIKEKQDLGY